MTYKLCRRCGKPFKGPGSYCAEDKQARVQADTDRRRNEPDRAIRSSHEWQATRERVKARDGHQCTYGTYPGDDPQPRRCRATTKLQVHHIVRPEDGGAPFDDDNARTLCPRHHAKIEARARADRRRKEGHRE